MLGISGSAVAMRVAGVDVELGPHLAAAVGPLLPHDVRIGPDAAHAPALALVLYLDDPELGRLTSRPADEGGPALAIDPAIRALAVRVATVLRAGADTGAEAASGARRGAELRTDLDANLEDLVARCSAALRAGGDRTHAPASPGDARVHAAVLMLRDGPAGIEASGGGVRPDDVARRVGLSRPHFYRLFREHVGLTPGEYLDALRADAAIARVISTRRTMTDIGEELGFASQASFTRFFRERVGVPPLAYRRGSPGTLDTAYLRLSGIRRRALRASIGACPVP